jgi:alpha-galactosidase
MNITLKKTIIRQLAVTGLFLISPWIAGAQEAGNIQTNSVISRSENTKLCLNFPKRVGVRPGHPFFQYIAVSGSPEKVMVENLPEGLHQNGLTLVGRLSTIGSYTINISATNQQGMVKGQMEIICGEQIALTPPLGWSSWNYCGKNVSDAKIRAMAKAMVDQGLIQYGYTYINIDDGWQGQRDAKTGALLPNEHFPDMKAMCDYVHSLGLKIGIYSTPWKTSYAGYTGGSADTADGKILNKGGDKYGAFEFHVQDAKQFAEWGFDYLKYDWNPNTIEHTQKMSDALRHSGRDIVFSLSNTTPFQEVNEFSRLAQVWRTTGDIIDEFKPDANMKPFYHSIVECGFMDADRWGPYVGPGHWADPDMLVVGNIGLGEDQIRESNLTFSEQKVHLTQWSLCASPLLLGCDISRLKNDILGLLKNEEVLAVNQDILGKRARLIKSYGSLVYVSRQNPKDSGEYRELQIWSKALQDGSKVVALFNLSDEGPKEVGFAFSDIGLSGEQNLRDLWQHKDLGKYSTGFSAVIPSRDVVMIKIQN